MAQHNRQKSPTKSQLSSTRAQNDSDKIFGVLQEMFHGKVDPEVVHMILTEMDWKVEKAIDTLLTFCGEGNTGDKKKNKLYRMAQEILCKDMSNSERLAYPSSIQSQPSHQSFNPNKELKLPSRSNKTADIPQLVRPPDISDHAIASNSMMSTVGLERRIASPSATTSPLSSSQQTIRNAMASAYGTHKESVKNDQNSVEPSVDPLSVDDDVEVDNNLLTQSILSGALNLSSTTVTEVSPLSPSKMYNPFSDSNIKESDLHMDACEAYTEKHWPDLSQSLWNKTSLRKEKVEKPASTNTFPGMYTDEHLSVEKVKSSGSMYEKLKKDDLKMPKQRQDEGVDNFPRTGIGNPSTSLLERLGLAEKNDKGQLKNLQKDPEEDLDLNFNMDTFDLDHDDSTSSDGSFLSQSGSAETMTAELKNMLGISKEEKREPTMLESAAKELERLNALSPNAKEFVPRSIPLEPVGSGSKSPKFLTPKASLPNHSRPRPPYTMVQQPFPQMVPGQHPPLRPMYPGPPPYTSQIPVMPVSPVGVRNVPPPPPPGSVAIIGQYGPVIPPPPNLVPHGSPGPPLMAPPGFVRVSSPSPVVFQTSPIVPASAPNNFYKASSPTQPVIASMSASFPSSPQLSSEPQQYATITANSAPMIPLTVRKEMSPSPERSQFSEGPIQKVKDMINSGERIFIIIRGLPGSGKSTLARELCGKGEICSADNYFMKGNVYRYDLGKISEAHDYCRAKAMVAVENGITPVIIDNTNTQVWEMCPYIGIARSVCPEYEIFILEPTTPWRFKARHCAEKTTHGVPYEQIKRMLDRYQRNVTVQMLINTRNTSKPVNVSQPNKNLSKADKPVAKAKVTPLTDNTDQGVDIWENIGSIKIKNPFDALMDIDDDENESNESEEEEYGDEKKKVAENFDPKNTKEKDETLVNNIEKVPEDEIRKSLEKDKNAESVIHPPAPLGFQIKPQKALSVPGLQKRIEKISRQKLLVSEKTCPSPITVPTESNENIRQKLSSRTPSFEKSESFENKYSDTIHELVDSLISEHVTDRSLKQSDIVIAQEELKAFLHIMSLDDQQRQDAGELIDYKLGLFLQEETDRSLSHKDASCYNPRGEHLHGNDFTHSVAESNVTVDSIELSLENVFNGRSEKSKANQESCEKSTDQNKNESRSNEIFKTECLTTAEQDLDSAEGTPESKDTLQKDIACFEKEYWEKKCDSTDSDKYITEGSNTNDRSEVTDINESNTLNMINSNVTSSEGHDGNFWNVENEVENKEEAYWKNGAKSLDKQEKISEKSDLPTPSQGEGLSKEGEVNTWDEPKSKRQRNKRERKRNGNSDQKNINENLSKSNQLAESVVQNKTMSKSSSGNSSDKVQYNSPADVKDIPVSASDLQSKEKNNSKKSKSVPPASKKSKQKNRSTQSKSSSPDDSQFSKSKSLPPVLDPSKNNSKLEAVQKDREEIINSITSTPEEGKSKKSKKRKGKGAKTEDKIVVSDPTPKSSDNKPISSVSNVEKLSEKENKPIPSVSNVVKGSDTECRESKKVISQNNNDRIEKQKSSSKEKSKNKPNVNDQSSGKMNKSEMNTSPLNITEDRSSFLVHHFIDSLDEDSKQVDTSSLLLMKKSMHELSIHSEEVKNWLEKEQVHEKLENRSKESPLKGKVSMGTDEMKGSSVDSVNEPVAVDDNLVKNHNNPNHIYDNIIKSDSQDIEKENKENHDVTKTENIETSSTQYKIVNHDEIVDSLQGASSLLPPSGEVSQENLFSEVTMKSSQSETDSVSITSGQSSIPGSITNVKSSTSNGSNYKTSAQESVDPSSSPQSKKKKKTTSRRKMAAKFPEKFLDDSMKEAFLNNDWKTQMPKLEGTPLPSNDTLELQPTETVERFDGNSSITSLDLKVLSQINDGNMDVLYQIEYPYKVCVGRDVSINITSSTDQENETNIPIALYHDKGTMTDNMCVVGLEFLEASFPTIPEKELKDMLERCDGDVEWAVNLLLDWKYHLNLSEEDSEKFIDAMFKSQHIPKSPIIHSSLRQKSKSSVISPTSLMDLCYDIVINQSHIDRQDLEQQLISNSGKRLKSLESQFSEVQKQYSFTSCGDDVIDEESEFTEALLQELVNSTDLSSSQDSSHNSTVDDSSQVCNGSFHTEDPNEFWGVSQNVRSTLTNTEKEPDRVTFDLDEIDEDDIGIPEREKSNVDRDRTDSFGEPTVIFPLKRGFTKVLYELFGQIEGIDTDTEDDIAIPVTLDVAKLVYTSIKTASRKGQIKIDSEQQLQQDEAYARRLQEEEDSEIFQHDEQGEITGPVNSTPQSFSRPPQSVIGINIDKSLTSSPKVVSLQEIIDEEEAKAIEKKELNETVDNVQVETLKQSGSFSALSTKLKQHKLYNEFPGIDQTVLDDIFHANCCNLVDTVMAIQGSLGYKGSSPKNVRSKEAEETYEKHLIEAAKQQSLQEMLDSCLHGVHVPKSRMTRQTPSLPSNIDYDEFRGEANLHYRLRHECFQKAQEAHRRGMKQVASFYADQGHLHTQKIKDANFKASEQILATRNELLEKNSTLDLHGLHVDEAVAALERILPSKEFELQTNPLKKRHYLIVVTGKGKHSQGGISKLKPAVMKYLCRNDYKFSEIHEGALRVSLKHRNIS